MKGVGAHRDKVIKTLTGGVGMLLKKNKVDVIEGHGSVTDDGNVKIGGQFDGTEIEANTVVLATGSIPKTLLGLSFGGRVLGTETAWALNELPETLAVIGCGASGVEVGSAFGRLGTKVTLLEALPQILPLEDEEIAKAAAREIAKQNVEIVTGRQHRGRRGEEGRRGADLRRRDQEVRLPLHRRRARSGRRGARPRRGRHQGERQDRAGGGGRRDAHLAEGRVRDRRPRAGRPGAGAQGFRRGRDRGGGRRRAWTRTRSTTTYIPRATFCYPQVASFGLTEKQAKEAGHDVVIGKIPMGAVGAPTVYGDRGGQIKIIGDKQYGELLGAHIVGVKAADMLQELVVAHDLEGGYPEVARSVHAHPTFSEAVMEAARAADGWLIHG